MKKVAIIIALMLFQAQIIAGAAAVNANVNKRPAQKAQQTKSTQVKQPVKTNVSKDDDYLLKYNINDLEAAPWLNGGKRKI